MTKLKYFLILISLATMFGCAEESDYPMEKRYWDHLDYANVTRTINKKMSLEQEIPSFSNPNTLDIIKKYTDQNNYKIILDDNELGLKHRNEIASLFFLRWKDMSDVYDGRDRKDKYVYEREMLEIYHFGLALQLKYFRLGNEEIIKEADDPNNQKVLYNVNSNVDTMIRNFQNYLDEVNDENAFSENGIDLYAKGLDIYFGQLINENPDSNYKKLSGKIDLLLKKSQSSKIKTSLQGLKDKLQSIIDKDSSDKN